MTLTMRTRQLLHSGVNLEGFIGSADANKFYKFFSKTLLKFIKKCIIQQSCFDDPNNIFGQLSITHQPLRIHKHLQMDFYPKRSTNILLNHDCFLDIYSTVFHNSTRVYFFICMQLQVCFQHRNNATEKNLSRSPAVF